MPRVVRRQPFLQRLGSFLNPLDHLLRLATDYEAFDWDNWQNTWGTPLGILLNVFCLISRGQADKFRRAGVDDVFRQQSGSSGMTAGLSYFLLYSSYALVAFSLANFVYCFSKKKYYRLFEFNVENEPATLSARRVRVTDSPGAGALSDPFRTDAASRSHPDQKRDVWEISVWDPTPLSLHLFSMFSPVHVAIYWLALPIPNSSASSPVAYETHISPAAVYFTVILTQVLLSAQVIWFKTAFMQQAKDQSVISKEVMHEYDHKYVHPRLNQLKRDVSVQCDIEGGRNDFVQAFTPQFAREGFRTFANPNYADFTGQSSGGDSWMPPRPHWSTPVASTASRPTTPFAQNIRQPVFERASSRPTMSTTGIQADENTSIALADRDREGERTTRERPRSTGVGADFEAQQRQQRRMGTEGMVDWSRHNSRGLSPSKMSTPLKKGSKIRGSTYAESLGTPLGTPVKRRQF